MKIHIINGTYGYLAKDDEGKTTDRVVTATRFDPPIDVDEKEAHRLVEMGIAEYVDFGIAGVAADGPETNNTENESSNEETVQNGSEGKKNENEDLTDDEDLIFTTEMTVAELRAALKDRGLSAKVGMTKQEMVDLLNGDDNPPDLTPQDVVNE